MSGEMLCRYYRCCLSVGRHQRASALFRHNNISRSLSDIFVPPKKENALKKTQNDSQPAISTPPVTPAMLDPLQTMTKITQTGAVRARRPTDEMFVSSILGGAYISFGGCLSLMMGAQDLSHPLTSALVFPMGLSLIVLSGVDLLTSNMMYGTLPFLTHPRRTIKTKLNDLKKLWSVNLAGNLTGCVFIAAAASTLLFPTGTAAANLAAAIATKKCSYSFGVAFGKAVGANWLVNLGVFSATTSNTTPGKMAALWMPITAFVALGLEHSVANMFFLPLGMLCGAEITIADMCVDNLMPVLLGNMVGAAIFTGTAKWFVTGGRQRRLEEISASDDKDAR